MSTTPFERTQSPPLAGTASAANAIARVKYTHDALIDAIIANPIRSQGELAQIFGYTQAWLSRIMNSDAFLARMAQRKADLVDPAIGFTIDEKLKALLDLSLDVVQEKLTLTRSADLALKAMPEMTKALGYGARQQNLNVQANFVVAIPAKVEDPHAWAAKHSGMGAGKPAGVIDVEALPGLNGLENPQA